MFKQPHAAFGLAAAWQSLSCSSSSKSAPRAARRPRQAAGRGTGDGPRRVPTRSLKLPRQRRVSATIYPTRVGWPGNADLVSLHWTLVTSATSASLGRSRWLNVPVRHRDRCCPVVPGQSHTGHSLRPWHCSRSRLDPRSSIYTLLLFDPVVCNDLIKIAVGGLCPFVIQLAAFVCPWLRSEAPRTAISSCAATGFVRYASAPRLRPRTRSSTSMAVPEM
jgi:hypothetical protein